MFKDVREFMIGDDNVFLDIVDGIDVVHDTVQNGSLPYFQQRFREILRQRIQTCGIAGCDDDVFHSYKK